MNFYNKIIWSLILLWNPSLILGTFGFGKDKVLLRDVTAITLYDGKMTNGRRSSPVPQLECIDQGTASCHSFRPSIVQCINKGSDGADVQWECKCDMDKDFKFGYIEVSCEGYDYPDDPYILKNSCGLKYSLDYTHGGYHYGTNHKSYKNSYSNRIADLIVYIAIGIAIYAFYVTCLRSNSHRQNAYSSTNDDYPSDDSHSTGGGGGYGWFGGNNTHPGYQDNASCRRNNRPSGGGGGGFWTGAATGGFLGYMLGNRWGGTNYHGYGYEPRYRGGGWGRSSSGSTSQTYSSSGFGGTSRR